MHSQLVGTGRSRALAQRASARQRAGTFVAPTVDPPGVSVRRRRRGLVAAETATISRSLLRSGWGAVAGWVCRPASRPASAGGAVARRLRDLEGRGGSGRRGGHGPETGRRCSPSQARSSSKWEDRCPRRHRRARLLDPGGRQRRANATAGFASGELVVVDGGRRSAVPDAGQRARPVSSAFSMLPGGVTALAGAGLTRYTSPIRARTTRAPAGARVCCPIRGAALSITDGPTKRVGNVRPEPSRSRHPLTRLPRHPARRRVPSLRSRSRCHRAS